MWAYECKTVQYSDSACFVLLDTKLQDMEKLFCLRIEQSTCMYPVI